MFLHVVSPREWRGLVRMKKTAQNPLLLGAAAAARGGERGGSRRRPAAAGERARRGVRSLALGRAAGLGQRLRLVPLAKNLHT